MAARERCRFCALVPVSCWTGPRSALIRKSLLYALCILDLAYVVGEQSRYPKAESLYREALCYLRKAFGDQHPGVVTQALNNLAPVLKRQGKYDQAEPRYREALAGLERRARRRR